jgi:AraC family transcriptional regulator
MGVDINKLAPALIRSQKISASDRGLGILTNEGALYIGTALNTVIHAAHAFKIYIAIEGKFDLVLDDARRWESLTSVMIAPDRPHKVVGGSAILAVFYLIPESVDGQRMAKYYCNQDVIFPAQHAVNSLVPRLNDVWERGCSKEEASEMTSVFCRSIFPATCPDVKFDRRIAFALEYLGAERHHRVTIPELSSAVSLSPSRLEHLFREQIGISITRYLLWIRLKKALEMMSLGISLTEVAHAVGFADSAHLSRTFRRLIGIAPSTLLKNIDLHFVGR